MRVRQAPRPGWISHHSNGELRYTLLWEFLAGWRDNSVLRSYPAALNLSTTDYSPRKCTCNCALSTCLSMTTTGVRACARVHARTMVSVHMHILIPSSHWPTSPLLCGHGCWRPSLAPFVNYV